MPIEIRHILFDESEVRRALIAFATARRKPFAGLSTADLQLKDVPDLRAFLSGLSADGALEVLEFTGTEIAVALILLCGQLRIPLPARASKELTLHERGLCMSLRLNVPAGTEIAPVLSAMP
jgi:hypothetical protein